MKKWIKLLSISIALLLLDIVIKRYVVIHIPKMSWLYPTYPYGGIGVFKDFFSISFSINYVDNPGAAWGAFSSYSTYLFYLRVVIISALTIYLFYSNPPFRRAMALCLIIFGALGNVLDYIFYKHVVDMFYFTIGSYSNPIFNLADCMITIGIIWVLLESFIFYKKDKEKI
jgi:signal peptidase II